MNNSNHTVVLVVMAVVISLLGVIPMNAQSTAEGNNPLDPIAWLVGGTWVAEANTPDGSPLTIAVTCDWASHKRLINFTVVFKSGGEAVPTYEGIYGWHPGKKKLAFWYADRQGNLTEGVVTVDGNKLELQFRIFGIDGQTRELRSTIVREGEDAYAWTAFVLKEGEWVEAASLNYLRRK